jgi:hypothetical protein
MAYSQSGYSGRRLATIVAINLFVLVHLALTIYRVCTTANTGGPLAVSSAHSSPDLSSARSAAIHSQQAR